MTNPEEMCANCTHGRWWHNDGEGRCRDACDCQKYVPAPKEVSSERIHEIIHTHREALDMLAEADHAQPEPPVGGGEKTVGAMARRLCLGCGGVLNVLESYYPPIAGMELDKLREISSKYQALLSRAEGLAEAADEVIVANGCGSPELFDRAIGKLRAALAEYEKGKEETWLS